MNKRDIKGCQKIDSVRSVILNAGLLAYPNKVYFKIVKNSRVA